MENEAMQRWKSKINALRNAFSSFEAKFKNQVSNLEGETKALERAFEEFANEFNNDVNELFSHIWGTQADKEAWQRKYGR